MRKLNTANNSVRTPHTKNGKAKQVELKKGTRTASAIQITDGLVEGDTLLVTGVMQLRDEMPVKIDKLK